MTGSGLNVSSLRRSALGMLAITSVACSTAAGPTSPQGEPATPKLPNIVLVHGAWADGSSWSAVIQRLQKSGYHVSAVQLTLGSFSEDVARTRALLAAQTGPTLVVAHSFGGAIITQLGSDAPNVIGMAYESAFAPDQGETMKALLSQPPQPPGAAAIYPDTRGFLWLEPDGFVKFFAPDVAPGEARAMAAAQTPIAASMLFDETPFGPPAWKAVPTWYLVTTEDQMLPPDAQRFSASRMGAAVTSLAGSHASMVSHPDAVADFIVKAAEGALASARDVRAEREHPRIQLAIPYDLDGTLVDFIKSNLRSVRFALPGLGWPRTR